MTRILQRVYLGLFLADGVVSVMVIHWPQLGWLNFLLAAVVAFSSLPLWGGVVLTPKFSPLLVLPICFALWANFCRAFPLDMLDSPQLFGWLAWTQVLIGLLGLMVWNSKRYQREFFAWKHLLVMAALSLLLGFLLFVSLIGGQTVHLVSVMSGNYARITFNGIYLKEKHFSRNGQEVRLIGMSHIADKKFYDQLTSSLPPDKPALVLLEGVSNRNKIPLSLNYQHVASVLGISSQAKSSFQNKAVEYLQAEQQGKEQSLENPQLRFRSADVDLSSFDPQTIRFLQTVSTLYGSKNWREFAEIYLQLNRDRKMQLSVMQDILFKRNEHLMTEIRQAQSPLIIVPWGALHMAYLESQLRQDGYQQVSQSENRVISFNN